MSTAPEDTFPRVELWPVVRHFGRVVCEHRRAQGMSGPEFAALAGIGKGHLSKIENRGENVSLSTICKIAAALKLSAASLIAECEVPNIRSEP